MNEYTYVDHNNNDLVLYKCMCLTIGEADTLFAAQGYGVPMKLPHVGVSIKQAK